MPSLRLTKNSSSSARLAPVTNERGHSSTCTCFRPHTTPSPPLHILPVDFGPQLTRFHLVFFPATGLKELRPGGKIANSLHQFHSPAKAHPPDDKLNPWVHLRHDDAAAMPLHADHPNATTIS